MKWLLRIFGSVIAAIVTTAGIATVTVIWLMFSAGSNEGQRQGYFSSLFVAVNQKSDGTTQLGVGLLDPTALIVTIVLVTLLLLAVMAVYDQLLARKKLLLADAQ